MITFHFKIDICVCTHLQTFDKTSDFQIFLSFYESENTSKLIDLKQIESIHGIEDFTPANNQLISKLLLLPSNLQIISIHNCKNR